MPEIELHLVVNRQSLTVKVESGCTLLELLRDRLGLTGTKEGCGAGDCGACVVVMDGLAVNACLVLAAQAEGTVVITIEGLAQDDTLHPLQQQFADQWAMQCGFCTPGMLMSCYALLLTNPNPTAGQIREAISGNLCRCGSYQAIVKAVHAAVEINEVHR
ncbi:MAG: (2Fe-2S)-binding protein [Anaerolineales bacterium]|nr:MAG: (2Fe-2S)-binding protein [Anaerolineales bacterium]